ncbi:MAG: metalloregulator ArsR/SmtB family transcription factor [Halobacteriales archaeon]
MSSSPEDLRIEPETADDLQEVSSRCDVGTAHDVFRALADERRVMIMRLLGESPLCVCDLVELFDMEYSKLSYHLRQLKDAGLVETERDGNYVTYQPTEHGEDVIDIVLDLC